MARHLDPPWRHMRWLGIAFGWYDLAVGASKCAKLDIQHSCLWDSCCPTLRQVHLIPQVSFNWATRLQEEYWILQVSLLVLQAFCSLYLLGLQKLVGGEKLAVFRGPCIKVAFKVTSTKTSKGKKMTLQSTFGEALQMEDPKIIKTYFHVMLNWEPMVLGYCRYPKFWALTEYWCTIVSGSCCSSIHTSATCKLPKHVFPHMFWSSVKRFHKLWVSLSRRRSPAQFWAHQMVYDFA